MQILLADVVWVWAGAEAEAAVLVEVEVLVGAELDMVCLLMMVL
jgi:hypothetical protein